MSVQPVMHNISTNDGRKRCSFSVENERVGLVDVQVKEYNLEQDRFRTEIFDSKKQLLGYDFFDMPKADSMFEYDITVLPEHRGKGLGELMRLTSIAQMLENNVDEMDLYSKSTAIYFHAKHGFEPNIRSFDQRRSSLEAVVANKMVEGDVFVPKAEKILKAVESPLSLTFEENQKYTMQTNELVKDFIKKVLAMGGQEDAKFSFGFNMKLMRDTIFERAEFFNLLFKKHGIKFKV